MKLIKYCNFSLIVFVYLITGCSERLFENIYDPQYAISAPNNITIDQISVEELLIKWNDRADGEEGYKIDKKIGDGNWENDYAILNGNETSFIDNKLDYDLIHYYRIKAFADQNNSLYSTMQIIPYYIAPLAFSDDFSENNFEWQVPSGNWNIVNGALIIDGPNDDYQHLAYKEASNNLEQPFRYVVDVDHITGNDEISAIGIGLYNMIEENTIVYFINPDGVYSLQLHDWNSNEWTNLIEPKGSVYISDDPATIEMIYYNDEMELYYNGNYLNKVTLYNKKYRAFLLYHQGTNKFSFDNVKYYAFDLGPLSKTGRIFNSFRKNNEI